jgi:hypothetical protein
MFELNFASMVKSFEEKTDFKLATSDKIYVFKHIAHDMWSIIILNNDALARVTSLEKTKNAP